MNGMVDLGINVDGEVWKTYVCERIQECGRRVWKGGFNDTERGKEYVRKKKFQEMKVLQMEMLVQG